jgi:nicotinate-nucleotide--dimethylbenzimidazole phosphoribosyltransferase
MAADHGVAEEGVSAYPAEVTGQMLLNFARGGAAINVLARQAGAEVVVVDMGTQEAVPPTVGIRSERLGPGTGNFTRGPAMNRETAVRALVVGIRIALELAREGVSLLGLGDMGIANTTTSSALSAAYTGAPPEEVTGRGTGIDDAAYSRKLAAVRRGLAVHPPDPADPLDTLARLGGFEIAGLAGVVLGAASARIPVVLDGFITSAAALAAVRLVPAVGDYLVASHRSVEKGHRVVLEALGARPLFDLELRLGEGTGAALAMGLIDASLRVLHEMATFAGAGVTDSGA